MAVGWVHFGSFHGSDAGHSANQRCNSAERGAFQTTACRLQWDVRFKTHFSP